MRDINSFTIANVHLYFQKSKLFPVILHQLSRNKHLFQETISF